MGDSYKLNERYSSNDESNGDTADQKETVMTFGDGLHYSDFENIEYEEVDDLSGGAQRDGCTSINTFRSRKRTKNFTSDECNIMVKLIEEYSDILELKRNDHKTNTLKNETWNEITERFNATTHETYRTPLQLKTFYENLKRKRKKLHQEFVKCETVEVPSSNLNKIQTEKSTKIETDKPSGFKRHNNFFEYYQLKKIELVEKEIEKIKTATEQQRRLFLLQEEKMMLEIQEIRERLKQKRKSDLN